MNLPTPAHDKNAGLKKKINKISALLPFEEKLAQALHKGVRKQKQRAYGERRARSSKRIKL